MIGLEFVGLINRIHPNIKFTIEKEQQKSLNFLDTTITRQPNRGFYFKSYHKSFSTVNPIPWDSNHPYQMKLGIFKGAIMRAITLNTHIQDLNEEIQLQFESFKR